jgi:hypothetical protein
MTSGNPAFTPRQDQTTNSPCVRSGSQSVRTTADNIFNATVSSAANPDPNRYPGGVEVLTPEQKALSNRLSRVLTQSQVATIQEVLQTRNTGDGWEEVKAIIALGLDGQSFITDALGNPLALSGNVLNTISYFTTPATGVPHILEFTQPLVKALFLRNWEIRDGDIKHLLQGINSVDIRFKDVATRAKANCRSYRFKIFNSNMKDWVLLNVTAFNRAANENDDAEGIVVL